MKTNLDNFIYCFQILNDLKSKTVFSQTSLLLTDISPPLPGSQMLTLPCLFLCSLYIPQSAYSILLCMYVCMCLRIYLFIYLPIYLSIYLLMIIWRRSTVSICHVFFLNISTKVILTLLLHWGLLRWQCIDVAGNGPLVQTQAIPSQNVLHSLCPLPTELGCPSPLVPVS